MRAAEGADPEMDDSRGDAGAVIGQPDQRISGGQAGPAAGLSQFR